MDISVGMSEGLLGMYLSGGRRRGRKEKKK